MENNKGNMTVREAGKRGGETRKQELGPEGYSKLGQKAHKDHPDLAQRAGSKGGQKVKDLINKGKKSEGEM